MNLNHPSAMLWAALAIPIVVFYILKIRLRRVPVSTILFWEQIFEEKRPRSLWQRLRHLVSLLVQLAFLLLLVLARAERLRLIDGLRFMDEVAIISAGLEPRVHCGLTGHQRTLRQALEAIPPT